MTANQINFKKMKEEAKHWRRQDKEARRHNVVSEQQETRKLDVQEYANLQNIGIGKEQNAINREHLERSDQINKEHYERSDAINQAHYERQDYNTQVANSIKNDELILNAVSTLGEPINADKLGFINYYSDDPKDRNSWLQFDSKPVSLDWWTPSNVAGYGRTLSAVENTAKDTYYIIRQAVRDNKD